MSGRFFDELDDPPTPEQAEIWSEVRERGRRRFAIYGAFLHAGLTFSLGLLAKLIVVTFFAKSVSWGELAVAWLTGFVMGWIHFRGRWTTNETRWESLVRTRGDVDT